MRRAMNTENSENPREMERERMGARKPLLLSRTVELSVMAAMFVTAPASGQTTPTFAYRVPASDSIRIVRDQPYRQGASGPIQYDLYLPPARDAARVPVVIVFNGGQGASRGVSLNAGWASLFAASGFAAVTYDSDPSGAEVNFDALVRALAAKGAERGLDLDRVALWAGSSNVSSALPIASDSARHTIRAAVMYYGAAAIPRFRADLPIQLIRVGLDQPALLQRQDSLIARALAFNAPIEVINHPSGEHPFEESSSRASARVMESSIAFLRRVLDPSFAGALAGESVRAEAGAASYAGDWVRASRAFQALAEGAPNDAELQRKLGDARLAAGDANGAVMAYLRSRELGHWRLADLAIGLVAAYAQSGRREQAYQEIANFRPTWNKAGILANAPQLAPFRDDPEFIRRMR
jgi:hypothetical protein